MRFVWDDLVRPTNRSFGRELIDRFYTKDDDCWLWFGARLQNGDGVVSLNGHRVPTHRLMYEVLVSKIPYGGRLTHLCGVKTCGNPRHLGVVTLRGNVLASLAPFALANVAETHCPQGHEYTAENSYVYPTGGVGCLACYERVSGRIQSLYPRLTEGGDDD